MHDKFEWVPSFNASVNFKSSAKKISFGGGYEQIVTSGMNCLKRAYSLSFAGRSSKIMAINDFLEKHGGVDWFYYKHQTESDDFKKFRCEEWTVEDTDQDVKTLTANFYQVFDFGE